MLVADDGVTGEAATSDGTSAGTYLVQDLFAGPWPGVGSVPVALNGSILVSGSDGVYLGELFRFPDTFAPFVWNSQFVADSSGSESVSFNFNEPVAGLSGSKLSITNLQPTRRPRSGPSR